MPLSSIALATTVTLALAGKMPSLEDAAARHGPAVVTVRSGDGATTALGFFVSSDGVVATVVDRAALPARGGELSVELHSGERRTARVVVVDNSGLLLLELARLDKDDLFTALPVEPQPLTAARKTPWLVGFSLDPQRGAVPVIGGARETVDDTLRLDMPGDPGAPVLADGKLVGIVVVRRGKTACTALSIDRLKALVR